MIFTLIVLVPSLFFIALLPAMIFANRPNYEMSNVVVYSFDHTTRRLETLKMDDRAKRKFLKHMFKRCDAHTIEIDGKPYTMRGNHVESI